jgi:threonine dehydratase
VSEVDARGGKAARAAGGARDRLVSGAEVRGAARRLEGVARRTPLLPGDLPDGRRVWLKCESLQRGGAFKVRGAYNFIARLDDDGRAAGLVTYSSGNHAQGVALAARAFGVRATIVMPRDAPAVKVRATRRLGGRIELAGITTTERRERAEAIARETGATIVPPYDHPDIIAGQGTVALEVVEQLREAAERDGGATGDGTGGRDPGPVGRPGLVLVPIGGGGLISGQAALLREMAPECRVVGVEPEGAASMLRSLEAGEPVTLEGVETVADGLKPVRPGDLTFRHVRELVDEVVTVDEDALLRAVRWHFERHLVVEPSGAATVAALLAGAAADGDAEGDVVATVSGGNVDPGLLAGWLESMDREIREEVARETP